MAALAAFVAMPAQAANEKLDPGEHDLSRSQARWARRDQAAFDLAPKHVAQIKKLTREGFATASCSTA